MLRSRLADGDKRRGFGQAIDLGDLPAELAFDALDGGGGRRRPRRQKPHAAPQALRCSSGPFAMAISTVGAAHRVVMRSRYDRS